MRRSILGILALCCTLSGETRSVAAEQPLRFQRIYAPADQRKDWVFEKNILYLPVEPQQFDKLTETARARQSGAPAARGVQLLQATYRARLTENDLVDGTALLEIKHHAMQPRVLTLAPCSLAMSEPVWNVPSRPTAVMGSQADGKLGVLVDKSGSLELQWTLRGKAEATDALLFDLELPACSTKTLILDLPSERIPRATFGVVTPEGEPAGGRQSWRIELGGRERLELRIVSRALSNKQRQLTLLRQQLTYDFSLRGIEVSTQVTLDIHREPIREISLAVDPSLRLIAAHYGETEIPWRISTNTKSGVSDVVLQLPEPIQGSGRVIRLVGVAPLKLEESLRLPTIRATGTFWSEGTSRLFIPSPLSLAELTLKGGRQTKADPLPAPRSGDFIEIQHYTPAATIDVVVTHRDGELALRQGTTVDVGPSSLTAQVRANFTVDGTERFLLQAAVARGWVIDSISSTPPGSISDWNVEPPSKGVSHLSVRLAKAVTREDPLRLNIVARSRQSLLDNPQDIDAFVPLRFLEVRDDRQLVLIRNVEPFQLTVDGLQASHHFDQETLQEDGPLLGPSLRGTILDLQQDLLGVRASLTQEPPRYRANVQVEALFTGASLKETYAIDCFPESSRVERLQVGFSVPSGEPMTWSIVGERGEQMVARRIAPPAEESADLEWWEIVLKRSRSEPFELRAVRSQTLNKETQISLAALRSATEQSALVNIFLGDDRQIQIMSDRLERIPIGQEVVQRDHLLRATLRYDPQRDVLESPQAALQVIQSSAASTASAWVYALHLDSSMGLDGRSVHLATFHLHSGARKNVTLTMPPGCRVDSLWIDGEQIPAKEKAAASRKHKIDLPTSRKNSVVAVQYRTNRSPVRSMAIISPQLPTIDLPVLSRDWTFWLPPGYEATSELLSPSSHSDRSWRQRLFGPWGRKSADPPRTPLENSNGSPSDLASREKNLLDLFLQRLEKRLATQDPSTELDWHELLSRSTVAEDPSAGDSSSKLSLRVLVDSQALATSGITPDQITRLPVQGNPERRATRIMQAADLVVLVSSTAIVLTSAEVAALHRSETEPIDGLPAHRVLPGTLLESLDNRSELPGSEPLVAAYQWTSRTMSPLTPWQEGKSASVARAGWHAYHMTHLKGNSISVRIVHRQTLRVLGWTTFLLVTSLCCWLLPGRPQVAVLVMGASACLALLLPPVYSFVATGVFLGIVVGLGILYLRGLNQRRKTHQDLSETGFVLPHATTALLLLACTIWDPASVNAQSKEAATEKSTVASPIHKVYIPVDEDRKPTGERYLVPEQFLFELQRRAGSVSDMPGGWMIRKALYRGVISRQAGGTQPAVEQLEVELDLHVFTPHQPIEIPLASKDLQLVTKESRLEGLPLEISYDPQMKVARFQVEESGDYRLRLLLTPSTSGADNRHGFEVQVPPVAISNVELAVPLDSADIALPTAHGVITLDSKRQKLSGHLGPTDRLVVQWPAVEEMTSSTVQYDVKELHWLTVQAGAVKIDSRLQINVVAGQLQQLRLAADPRLQLFSQEENSPIASVSTQQGTERILVLDLKKPITDQVVIPVRMLLTGVSGVGNLRLPVLRVIAPGMTQRQLGVTVDPSLEYEVKSVEALKSLAVQEFAADWGNEVEPPTLAYHLPQGDADWTLATHPRQTLVKGDDTLSLILGRREAELRYEANLDSDAGYFFQHQARIPPSIEVNQVVLERENESQPVRWTRNGKGLLTVFFSSPLSGSHRLVIDGRLNLGKKKSLGLPHIALTTGTCQQRRVQIFRRPEVEVKVEQLKGLVRDAEILTLEKDQTERLVEHYQWDGKTPMRARIEVSPNVVKLAPSSTLITQVARDANRWTVQINADLQVVEGVLDDIRLEIPSWITAPFQVQPAADLSIIELSGDRGRQIEIRPHTETQESLQVQIRGTLELANGSRLRIPHVRPLGLDPIQQYLVLPNQFHLKPISWTTRGLRASDLKIRNSTSLYSKEAYSTFLIPGDSFEAIPRSASDSMQFPRVRLADIRLAWREDGEYHGVAAFDLEPAGADSCGLHLPESLELIEATVSGVPGMLNKVSPQNWNLALGPPRLPQRIEILFRGSINQSGLQDEIQLPCPVLQTGDHAIHVERSLWTVFSPEDVQCEIPQRATLVDAVHQELLRLQGITSLLDLDTETTSHWSSREMADWYRPWARRMLASRDAVVRNASVVSQPGVSEGEVAEAESLVSDHQEISRRLGTSTLLRLLANQPVEYRESIDLWQTTYSETPSPTRMMFQGYPSKLVLPVSYTTASDLPVRLGITLLVVILATGLVTQHHHIGKLDLLSRWPHALGVLVGLFWYLWLTPSFVGLIIAIVSVLLSLRTHWRSGPQISPGSTIMRLPSESKLKPR